MSTSGSQTLTILGDVTLILTGGSGVTTLSVAGNGAVNVPAGSSLTIYTEGNLRIAGNSIVNGNAQPVACTIYGTNQTYGGVWHVFPWVSLSGAYFESSQFSDNYGLDLQGKAFAPLTGEFFDFCEELAIAQRLTLVKRPANVVIATRSSCARNSARYAA